MALSRPALGLTLSAAMSVAAIAQTPAPAPPRPDSPAVAAIVEKAKKAAGTTWADEAHFFCEAPRANDRKVPYPFVAGKEEPYIPASRPSLAPGAESRISLVGYHLRPGRLQGLAQALLQLSAGNQILNVDLLPRDGFAGGQTEISIVRKAAHELLERKEFSSIIVYCYSLSLQNDFMGTY